MKGFVVFCLFPLFMVVNMREFEKIQMCKDGDAHDQLLPDDICFTCKSGPGNAVKCLYLSQSLKKPFNCPGFGYISGWHVVGFKVIVKCCSEPGLQYLPNDCRYHLNTDVAQGRIYRVDKGKVITGFKTVDGGITYYNRECMYNTSPKYNPYSKY